jgi:hypothetical protein
MKNKHGKWYADWRDARGVRHAKAFPTKKAARLYSKRMQKEAQAGKARRSRRSAKSQRRGSKSPASATPK